MRQKAGTVHSYQRTHKYQFYKFLASVMVIIVPSALLGADSKLAMLQPHGRVLVNGSQVPNSFALFSGDQVETQAESVASITSPGSTLTVLPDSAVTFDSAAITVRHGGLTILTSKGVSVRAGCLVISPGSASWTDFQVGDSGGVVEIAARRGNLNIEEGGVTTPLLAGQQTTGNECGQGTENRKSKGGAAPVAAGGLVNSKALILVGVAITGGILAWVLVQGEQPVSPSKP